MRVDRVCVKKTFVDCCIYLRPPFCSGKLEIMGCLGEAIALKSKFVKLVRHSSRVSDRSIRTHALNACVSVS